ncbi:hypothetical protein [Actinoplanes subtropicus]|uniref:hypothetical protein n=1 Tax=Actinoplanes subtropicus TaxID=543632 RepID=UPI000691ED5E|nr:hypothetical protein [Actinoplanes subtropicus]
MRTRILAALGLALLAPLIGEYLLGNLTIRDLAAIPFLAPMYGGGALLIREIARRTGRGWPAILVLGLAYGVLEPGIFDGSLFALSYEGVDYAAARVPVLGFSAFYGLQFVINHAVWSITIPIVLTESLARRHRATPWLGRAGLAVTAVIYVLGGLLIRSFSIDNGQYKTSWTQAAGVLLVAAMLVAVALRLPRPSPARSAGSLPRPWVAPVRSAGWVPRPWVAAVATFVVSGGYFVLPAGWPGVAAVLAIAATAALVVARLARHAGWNGRHRVALATGAVVTYAAAAFSVTAFKHDNDPLAFAGNCVFAVAVLVLCALAAAAAHPTPAPEHLSETP